MKQTQQQKSDSMLFRRNPLIVPHLWDEVLVLKYRYEDKIVRFRRREQTKERVQTGGGARA